MATLVTSIYRKAPLFCMAPRGGGYSGEKYGRVRHAHAEITVVRTPDFPYETEVRVKFLDGFSFWVPLRACHSLSKMSNVSY